MRACLAQAATAVVSVVGSEAYVAAVAVVVASVGAVATRVVEEGTLPAVPSQTKTSTRTILAQTHRRATRHQDTKEEEDTLVQEVTPAATVSAGDTSRSRVNRSWFAM